MFKQRIVLDQIETVIHSESDFAPVAYLRIKEAHLENKDPAEYELVVPPLLDDEFASLQNMIQRTQDSKDDVVVSEPSHGVSVEEQSALDTTSSIDHPWVFICNIQAPGPPEDFPFEVEVERCFHTMKEHLASHSLDLSHVTNIMIFLSSIDDFALLNRVYATHFGTNPPSRACVAVDLPSSLRVRLDCVANSRNSVSERQALHVQGLSYWAPANIGPYSQAVLVIALARCHEISNY
jgi:diphthine-ammonia ligase